MLYDWFGPLIAECKNRMGYEDSIFDILIYDLLELFIC